MDLECRRHHRRLNSILNSLDVFTWRSVLRFGADPAVHVVLVFNAHDPLCLRDKWFLQYSSFFLIQDQISDICRMHNSLDFLDEIVLSGISLAQKMTEM